jgi:uncharacterized protein YndB with AHSA1/START domain
MTAQFPFAPHVIGEPTLSIQRVFAFPREVVFDAWTDPDLLTQWFAPDGCTLHVKRLDIRAGGGLHWCVRNPAFGDCWTVGTYSELVRPERIVFTSTIADAAGVPASPASQGHDPDWPSTTVVKVTFVQRQEQTLVTLEQAVSTALAERTGAHPSWLQMLDRLGHHLASPGR